MLHVWPRVRVKNPGFIRGGQRRTCRLQTALHPGGPGLKRARPGRFFPSHLWVLLTPTHSYTHTHIQRTPGDWFMHAHESLWQMFSHECIEKRRKKNNYRNRQTSLHRLARGCWDQSEAGGGKGEDGVKSTWNRRSFQVAALNFLQWGLSTEPSPHVALITPKSADIPLKELLSLLMCYYCYWLTRHPVNAHESLCYFHHRAAVL